MKSVILRERERERERIKTAVQLFSYKNLLRRYYECRSGKRFTVNALKFEARFEEELFRLRQELISHTYKPGPSICFVVTRPKVREIFASDFRDRIVQHVLVGYLEPVFERRFIDQSYACRKGRGAHRALGDLDRYIRKVTRGGVCDAWYLQVDIRSFFVSLDKQILFEMICGVIKNPDVLWLVQTILSHDPAGNVKRMGQPSLFDLIPEHKSLFKTAFGKGLPIGNLTSQFFANVYLDKLDQFIKHTLKIRWYLRYVDDLIILSDNKGDLMRWRHAIDDFLVARLKLVLHPKKQKIQRISSGIDFIGFITKLSHRLIRRRVVRSLKGKLDAIDRTHEQIFEEEMGYVQSMINSYFGQFQHARTFGLRTDLWCKRFGKLEKFLEPSDANISHFVLKEEVKKALIRP